LNVKGGAVMGEPEDKLPVEVLRAKRLEIVDDEGKFRAALGTDEKGIASLSLFDASGRLRSSLDAEEIPGHLSGLALYDTNGNLRASVGVDNDPEKGSSLTLYDMEGKSRVGVGLQTGGQAGLGISAGKKDRAVKIAAMDDGNVYLMLSGEDAPMVGLTLSEEEGKDPSADLMLTDKDTRAGGGISGRRSGPSVKLIDRREKVRASFELGPNGQPGLYTFDEEGVPVQDANAFDRVVAERGPVYQAVLLGSLLVAGGIAGALIARTASDTPGSLPAALFTVVVLAALVGLWIMARRRGW
jgi:hypothetical protein